jgi:glycerol kinase
MTEKFTLAIDQSTSATKFLLFDDQAGLRHRLSLEHRQYYPKAGWVEHDPAEIIENIYKGVEVLLNNSGVAPGDIVSVAITNQRESVLVWDAATSKPVSPVIVWQCQRGAAICAELKNKGYEEMLRSRTGLIIDPYFSASGVQWILEEIPGLKERARAGELRMGTMDSWLIWNLTGGRVHATDQTNASRTLLYNIHSLSWDREILSLFGIPESMLPRVLACDQVFGNTDFRGLLPRAVPIAGVLGDSHGALVGQSCFTPGMGKATYGTGSSVMVNIGSTPLKAPEGLVTSVAFAALGKTYYAFEGNIHCTGATIKWMEDELGLLTGSAESEALALSVDDNAGVYLVPAFAGLGAPWWKPDARAIICGLTRGSNRAHLVRAGLEAIAYQVKDLVDLMLSQAGTTLEELRVDGGPVRNRFLMQFQADMLNAPINVSPIEEASALGAVYMNFLAQGRVRSLEQLSQLKIRQEQLKPRMNAAQREQLYAGWQQAVKMIL